MNEGLRSTRYDHQLHTKNTGYAVQDYKWLNLDAGGESLSATESLILFSTTLFFIFLWL
jgi:hypothetical protein